MDWVVFRWQIIGGMLGEISVLRENSMFMSYSVVTCFFNIKEMTFSAWKKGCRNVSLDANAIINSFTIKDQVIHHVLYLPHKLNDLKTFFCHNAFDKMKNIWEIRWVNLVIILEVHNSTKSLVWNEM